MGMIFRDYETGTIAKYRIIVTHLKQILILLYNAGLYYSKVPPDWKRHRI